MTGSLTQHNPMSPEDRLRILREAPPNSWIALSDDESSLAGKGATYNEAIADAARNGSEDPILIRIPQSWTPAVLQVRVNYKVLPLTKAVPWRPSDTSVWMPIVHVSLMHKHRKTKRVEAIVDSGAPCCLFSGEACEALGIELTSGIAGSLSGVIRSIEKPTYYHQVTLEIYGNSITTMAGFCPELSVTAILGRIGFFENFKITFDSDYNPPGMELERIYRS